MAFSIFSGSWFLLSSPSHTCKGWKVFCFWPPQRRRKLIHHETTMRLQYSGTVCNVRTNWLAHTQTVVWLLFPISRFKIIKNHDNLCFEIISEIIRNATNLKTTHWPCPTETGNFPQNLPPSIFGASQVLRVHQWGRWLAAVKRKMEPKKKVAASILDDSVDGSEIRGSPVEVG